MTTGRGVVTTGQIFEVREFEVPSPAPGTILLKQELGGICGTDLHNWQQGIATPTLQGHEGVGIIEAMGEGVTEDFIGQSVKEGDRVAFHPRNSGLPYGFRSPEEPFSGTFGDYIYLRDSQNCFIKTETPPEVSVLAEPFGVGVHSAMRAGVQIGDTVIIQGSGAIGLMCLIAAKISGAARMIVIGGPAGRLELAKKLGADVTIDIAEVPNVEERKELVLGHTQRGEGADVVFEAAGFLPAFPEGLEYVKLNGVFTEVGHFVDIGTIAVNPNQHFCRRNLRLEAIWGSNYDHFTRAMSILERMEFPFADMVSHQLPLDRVADGFNALNGSYHLGDEEVVKVTISSSAV